jgi:hypothetical protein
MRKNHGKAVVKPSELQPRDEQETSQLPEYVPAELNLETIGFFSAGYKRRYPKEPHEAKIVNLGTQRQIRIVPSTYGYPNSEDLDLYRAFLKICDEHATIEDDWRDGFLVRRPRLKTPICFSTRQLLRYAGYKKNAQILRRVQEWIKRGVITGIEGGIYEAKTRRIKEGVTFTLFGKAYLRGEQMTDGKVADTNYIWPADWFSSNYFLRYFRPVDLAFHRRLQRPIAKTLYPILETGWYAADGSLYAKSYADLCALLFIPHHKQLSLAKQQLDPSHEELQREGFLDVWEYPLDHRRKWTGVIRWWPGSKWFQDQDARRGSRDFLGQVEQRRVLLPSPAPTTKGQQSASADMFQLDPVLPQFGARSHADRVIAFYGQQGHPRISQQKVEKEVKILKRLQGEGFTEAEVDAGLAWLLQNREKFGGHVHSLKLLPQTIGQALKEKRQVQERKETGQWQHSILREQQGREVTLLANEEAFQELSPAEQQRLRDVAVANLLRNGYKADVVRELKSLVKTEIYRLLEEGEEKGTRERSSDDERDEGYIESDT